MLDAITSPLNVAATPVIFLALTSTKVDIPVAFNPVVSPIIVNPPPFILTPLLAVTIPTESTLVTSSYVNVPPIDIVPGTVRSPFLLTVICVNVVTPAVISFAKI